MAKRRPAVDAEIHTLVTDFVTYKAAVVNVIPPQQARATDENAGVADAPAGVLQL
jgi:hypothetical protein